MSIELHQQWALAVNRHGVVGRRSFLRGITAAAMATGSLNWVERMAVEAAQLRQQNRACILLWMQGGPSQFETFSPKPNQGNFNLGTRYSGCGKSTRDGAGHGRCLHNSIGQQQRGKSSASQFFITHWIFAQCQRQIPHTWFFGESSVE